MKDHVKQPIGGEPLRSVVADAYQALRRHKPPTQCLDVCLNCCMSPALEREMRQLPLRELKAHHFYEYNTSAKSEQQPAAELLYFLPRLLELMAQGANLHHSTELYLDRLGRCDAAKFSKVERAAIDAYALAFFAEGLAQSPRDSAGRFMGEDAVSILLMFNIGGIDVARLLAHWLDNEAPTATMHYVWARYWALGCNQPFSNPFADKRPGFQDTIADWMQDVDHRSVFAQRILALDLSDVGDETCAKECCKRLGLKDMSEAVFDWIVS
ncbi:MAG: hypothetical protein HEQ39_00055 [Rhizobacter sp.]